jgi:hypothetical protein
MPRTAPSVPANLSTSLPTELALAASSTILSDGMAVKLALSERPGHAAIMERPTRYQSLSRDIFSGSVFRPRNSPPTFPEFRVGDERVAGLHEISATNSSARCLPEIFLFSLQRPACSVRALRQSPSKKAKNPSLRRRARHGRLHLRHGWECVQIVNGIERGFVVPFGSERGTALFYQFGVPGVAKGLVPPPLAAQPRRCVAERTCTTIVLDHEHENQKHG